MVWNTSGFFGGGGLWALNSADLALIQSQINNGGVGFNFRLVSDTGNETWEVAFQSVVLRLKYRLPNNSPSNAFSLNAAPATVTSGATTNLVANGFKDNDGTVSRVRFYRSTHSGGDVQADDVVLGDGTAANGQWQWSGSTAGWPIGTNYVFAQAQDDDGAWSLAQWAPRAVVTVSNVAPQIGAFSANPGAANLGDSVTLSASGVTDADGDGIQRIRFYRSTHTDGRLHWDDVALTIVNPNWNNDQAGLDDTQDNFGFWSLATKSVKCKDTSDPKNKAKNGTWKPGALPPAVLATLDDLNIQAVV